MRYIVSFVKVIVLVTLISTSIYQTGKLWFEDTSDRNFFYDVFKAEKKTVSVVNPNGDIIVPEQLGIYMGSSAIEYTVIRRGAAAYNSIEEAAVSAIARILKEGTYVGVLESEKDLWKKEHLLMTLPFDYPIEVLQKGYELEGMNLGKITSISSFILVPAGPETTTMKLYAESGDSDDVYEFSINEDRVKIDNEILSYQMNSVVTAENNAAYISTRKNGLPYYARTMLLPVVRSDIRYHSSIRWDIPYVDNGSINQKEVRDIVGVFFNNPETIGMVEAENVVRFRVGNITVTYNTEGLLTYSDTTESKAKVTLDNAIGLVSDFMKMNNSSMLLEYYLSDYSIEGGQIILYYSSGYNGFPIMMDEATQEENGMRYPIEVVVKGDRISEFRSLTREVPEILPKFELFDAPYVEALDQLILQLGPFKTPIDDMYLGYQWAESGETLGLHWVVELGEETYFVNVGDQ